MRHAALLFAIATSTLAAQQRVPHIVHVDRATHVAGDPSGIVIEGAKPGESLTITARRTIIRSRRAPATGTDTATYESYATFRADRAGQVKIDQATPTSGS